MFHVAYVDPQTLQKMDPEEKKQWQSKIKAATTGEEPEPEPTKAGIANNGSRFLSAIASTVNFVFLEAYDFEQPLKSLILSATDAGENGVQFINNNVEVSKGSDTTTLARIVGLDAKSKVMQGCRTRNLLYSHYPRLGYSSAALEFEPWRGKQNQMFGDSEGA